MTREYYVYIVTNGSGTLYTDVTNNLVARLGQHRSGKSKFTSRYNIGRLVFFETTPDVSVAIAREKEIKGWTRQKKFALIAEMNPRWLDLSDGWLEDSQADD